MLPRGRSFGIGGSIRLLSLLLIPAAVLGLYLPPLHAPFIFDDATSVQLNPTIRALRPLANTFVGTRPLLNFSYALTYGLGGGAPWGHRLGNVLLHLANALLVYVWVRMTLRLPRFQPRYPDGHWIALTVALLFAVHPLQTEAVTYVSGRPEALAAFFTLIAMVCAATALHCAPHEPRAIAARVAMAVAVVLGVLTKENAAATPALLLVYDSLASARPFRRVLRDEWVLYAFFATGAVALLWAVFRNPDYAHTAGFAFGTNPWGISALEYLATEPGVVVRYARLLVLPVGQCFDYDWPVAASFFAPGVWCPALLLLGAGVCAWRLRQRAPLYALAIAWFFIALAPTSSFVPIADVIAERRVYLASIGVFLAVVLAVRQGGAWIAARVPAYRALRPAAVTALLCLLGGLGWLTYERNLVWQDALGLWEDSARTSPESPRTHTNLGARQLERGNLAAARSELERALDLIRAGRSRQATPRQAAYAETYLAVVYLKQLELDRAAAAYQQAVELGAETYLPLTGTLRQIRDALAQVGYSRSPEAHRATPDNP